MNSINGSNGSQPIQPEWIEIRDYKGRLLFKYNPARNEIEFKEKGSDLYTIIRLDEIRLKHGYTPEDMSIVFIREYITVDNVVERNHLPYSTPTQKPQNEV